MRRPARPAGASVRDRAFAAAPATTAGGRKRPAVFHPCFFGPLRAVDQPFFFFFSTCTQSLSSGGDFWSAISSRSVASLPFVHHV